MENGKPQPSLDERKWNDKKELLLKWIEAGRPSEGKQQAALWEEFGKQLKEIIKDITGKIKNDA